MASKLHIIFRPRSPLEATDLGWLLARRYYGPLLALALCLVLPFFILSLILGPATLSPCLLACWWLKIFWERPLLDYLSHEFLGQRLSVLECLKRSPKLFALNFFSSLTWRRFSLSRSMDLPVLQLEALRGKELKKRLHTLHAKPESTSLYLGFFGMAWEAILSVGLLMLGAFLIPEALIGNLKGFLEKFFNDWEEVIFLAPYLAMATVAPFYVSAGFSLYLNRRTELEAWDIQQVFESLKSRYEKKVLGLSLMLIFLGLPQMASAQDLGPYPAGQDPYLSENKNHQAEAIDILHSPPFKNTRLSKKLVWKKKSKQSKQDKSSKWFYQIWTSFFKGLSQFTRIVLWLVFLLVFGVLLYWWRPWTFKKNLAPKASAPLKAPLKKTPLPPKESLKLESQAFEKAWMLLQSGHLRPALSLLYRASLVALAKSKKLATQKHQTEKEVLQAAKSQLKQADYEFLNHLISYWKQVAYAHQRIESKSLEKLFNQASQLKASS